MTHPKARDLQMPSFICTENHDKFEPKPDLKQGRQ
jgi:hypothetical protein